MHVDPEINFKEALLFFFLYLGEREKRTSIKAKCAR